MPVLVAVLMTCLGWGVALLPQFTLSTEVEAPSIHPACRVDPRTLECSTPYQMLGHSDLAAAWVENPIDYFYRDASRSSKKLPNWNPYIGSGYPIIFDGHNSHYSPTRWFLRHFPGDGGRDVVIFLRVLIWVLGVALFAHWCGVGNGAVAIAAFGAAFVTNFTGTVDHVFLDIHALAPWFGAIVAAVVRGAISIRTGLLSAIWLGALIGTLGFLQAQFTALVAMGFVALTAIQVSRARVLWLAFAGMSGFLLLFPAWYPMVRNIDAFVTSRNTFACIAADDKAGLGPFVSGLMGINRATYLAGSLAGFGLITMTVRHWNLRFPCYALLGFLLIVIFGMPIACSIPGISGVRFAQHLFPYTQAYFLIGVALSIQVVLSRWPQWAWKRMAWVSILFLLVMPPFLLSKASRQSYVGKLFTMALPRQIDPFPIDPPSESPWAKIRELSQVQDRRHFSPWGFLMPNWSAAFGILDLRLIAALYPVDYYQLNAGLFDHWYSHRIHGMNPDRFVVPAPFQRTFDPDFQRVLIANRVSLLTFRRGGAFFANTPDSPYAKERCRLVKNSLSIEAYLCPSVGGIGFFPSHIARVASSADALSLLKKVPLSRLSESAFIESKSEPFIGRGRVRAVTRSVDTLVYDLEVEVGGTFLVADTWFPGWEAQIDGDSVPISRANVAFKAVSVPEGHHRLAFHFSPRRW